MSERDDLMEQAHLGIPVEASLTEAAKYRMGLAEAGNHHPRYRVSLWKGYGRRALAARWEDERVVEAIRFVLMWKLPGDTHVTIEVIEA